MAALERLGYKVWHGTKWSPIWFEISAAGVAGNATRYKTALDEFVQELSIDGYDAILDQPGAYIYEDLMEYYPEAKVLNTVRDRDSWSRSMVEMAFSLDLLVWQPPHSLVEHREKGRIYGYWMKQQLGIQDDEIFHEGVPFKGSNFMETKSSVSLATCAAAYDRYQKKVRATVPPDRLVVYSVKDGWGPLCRHFSKDGECPEEAFPSVNSKEAGFLHDWKLELQTKIDLYKIHPMLARDWLVAFILYVLQRRAILATVVVAVLTLLALKKLV